MENYRDQLQFFFTKSGLDIASTVIAQLDVMSEEELKILYDIVFSPNEKARYEHIDVFYAKMEEKQDLTSKEMSDMISKMTALLKDLQEISDKSSNEDDFSKNIVAL